MIDFDAKLSETITRFAGVKGRRARRDLVTDVMTEYVMSDPDTMRRAVRAMIHHAIGDALKYRHTSDDQITRATLLVANAFAGEVEP